MLVRTMPVWIENRDGTIVRGTAESVTSDGALVRLVGTPRFDEGEGVALRISVTPGRPTVAATARISWIRSDDGPAECGLEWTSREVSLDEWLVSTLDRKA